MKYRKDLFMKTTKHFKCTECGAIFPAAYDSREKSLHVSKCACGKADVIMPGVHRYIPNDFVDQKYESEETAVIYSEDNIHFDGEVHDLLSQAKQNGKLINKSKNNIEYEFYDDGKSLELALLSENRSGEVVTIKAKTTVFYEYGWDKDVAYEHKETFKKSLKLFVNIENRILNENLDISNVKTLERFNFTDMEKRQLDLYDYDFNTP